MYVLNASKTVIHNTDYIERFHMVDKGDAVLIIASQRHGDQPDTLGRYGTVSEARSVLLDLFTALYGGASCFEMPQSVRDAGEIHVKDARTKRKGGS